MKSEPGCLGIEKFRRAVPGLLFSLLLMILSAGLCSSVDLRPSRGAPNATVTPPPLYLPQVMKYSGAQAGSTEWSQHAHDAQRTSYTDQVVAPPWRWKWAWNGPNASGGVSAGKTSLPRNVQPVTGAGRVYVAAGSRGVFALNNASGAPVWNATNVGVVNSTVAYDADTQAVFVVSSNGTLYKLNASSGSILAQFSTGAASNLPLPPAIISDRVLFSMGTQVYAVDKFNLGQIWAYNAGAEVETPPAYSVAYNRVVAVSSDLYVHAINNSDGSRAWRVKPTGRVGGDPAGFNETLAEARYGWPVIAERHGLALIKYRLDWQTMWVFSPWPTTNSQMRTNLQNQPNQQALFALNLSDGSVPFIINVGHGGYGDGDYLPMGPQPAVKPLPDGKEVVWTVIRGGGMDGRGDSHMGEVVLDSTTVSGLQAGYVRWMEDNFTNYSMYFPTDEQPNVSIAGDYFFSGHWEAGAAFRVVDRSSAYGLYNNPIQTDVVYAVASSQDDASCPFSSSHYCPDGLENTRSYPPGFYIYYNQGNIYDRYWSEYAAWVVSKDTVYFRSCDGAIVALESGAPQTNAINPWIVSAVRQQDSPNPDSLLTHEFEPTMIITDEQARLHAGEFKIVEFVVRRVINNGARIIVAAGNPHQGSFKAIIRQEDWPNFGSLPQGLFPLNQIVRVSGAISWYQGDPVIYISSPSQIR